MSNGEPTWYNDLTKFTPGNEVAEAQLRAEIGRLQARVAHMNLDIENLRAAVREACLIFNDHVLTQDIDSATEGAVSAYLAAHSIPEKKP